VPFWAVAASPVQSLSSPCHLDGFALSDGSARAGPRLLLGGEEGCGSGSGRDSKKPHPSGLEELWTVCPRGVAPGVGGGGATRAVPHDLGLHMEVQMGYVMASN